MPTPKRIVWGNGSIALTIAYREDAPPTIEFIRHTKGVYQTIQTFENPQSMVQIGLDGLMQENFGSRYSETLVGNDAICKPHDSNQQRLPRT